jgi:hypothetical protein
VARDAAAVMDSSTCPSVALRRPDGLRYGTEFGPGLRYDNPARCGHNAIRRIGRARPAAASGRPVDGLEELAAAGGELAHQAAFEFVDRENRRLDLGQVAWLARPRRQVGSAIMGDEVLLD